MKKLFLATSFTGYIDVKSGKIKPEFRRQIESIINALRGTGFNVFCAAEYEGWEIANSAPEVGVKIDLAEIDRSDALLAILHDSISAGVQFEIGYAVGQGKKVFVATNEDHDLVYFNKGAANSGKMQHVLYDQPKLLAYEINTRMTKAN